MKAKKRIVALTLMVCLIVSLIACGQSSPSASPSSSAPADGAAVSSSDESVDESPVDPIGRYAETITLHTVRDTDAQLQFPDGDDITNNAYTRYIEDLLNVKVVYDWVVDSTQYTTKLNASIAAGNIPDYFKCPPDIFQNLVKNGMVADITDVYNTYAGDYQRLDQAAFPEGWNSAVFDGKLMGIPSLGYGDTSAVQLLWIRTDWMNQAGLQAPKTIEELKNMAKTFMQQHPGSYGIALNNTICDPATGVYGIGSFFNGFGSYPQIWVKDASSGQLVYGSTQPAMKTALQELQDMYKDGILSQEFGAMDNNKVDQDIANSKVGIFYGLDWAPWMAGVKSLCENDADAEADKTFFAYPFPTVDGSTGTSGSAWPVEYIWVVNKDCQYPEAVIKEMNGFWTALKDNDLKAKLQSEDPVTKFNSGPIWNADLPERDATQEMITYAIEKDDISYVEHDPNLVIWYEEGMKWVKNKDPKAYPYYAHGGGYPSANWIIVSEYTANNKVLYDAMRGMPPGLAGNWSTLQKMETTAITQIIMGSPVSDYDSFVTSWGAAGGTAGTEEVNQLYNSN